MEMTDFQNLKSTEGSKGLFLITALSYGRLWFMLRHSFSL